jgi:transposase InsO family protein
MKRKHYSVEQIVAVLKQTELGMSVGDIVADRSEPAYLRVDNDSEFSWHLLDLWAYHQKTKIDFSRPGKPTDNSFIESQTDQVRLVLKLRPSFYRLALFTLSRGRRRDSE